jgi:hypothetical protein
MSTPLALLNRALVQAGLSRTIARKLAKQYTQNSPEQSGSGIYDWLKSAVSFILNQFKSKPSSRPQAAPRRPQPPPQRPQAAPRRPQPPPQRQPSQPQPNQNDPLQSEKQAARNLLSRLEGRQLSDAEKASHKSEYRRLSTRLHPDKNNGDAEATDLFKRMTPLFGNGKRGLKKYIKR